MEPTATNDSSPVGHKCAIRHSHTLKPDNELWLFSYPSDFDVQAFSSLSLTIPETPVSTPFVHHIFQVGGGIYALLETVTMEVSSVIPCLPSHGELKIAKPFQRYFKVIRHFDVDINAKNYLEEDCRIEPILGLSLRNKPAGFGYVDVTSKTMKKSSPSKAQKKKKKTRQAKAEETTKDQAKKVKNQSKHSKPEMEECQSELKSESPKQKRSKSKDSKQRAEKEHTKRSTKRKHKADTIITDKSDTKPHKKKHKANMKS